MNTLMIIAILLLAVAALIFSQLNRRPLLKVSSPPTGPRQFDGLFAEQRESEARLLAQAEAKLRAEEEQARLLQRAAEGEVTALDEAHERKDDNLYREALSALIIHADGNQEVLQSIAKHILESKRLRSISELALMMIEVWSRSLDRGSMIDMLYLSALSDDCETFQRAIETTTKEWCIGRLSGVTSKEILDAIESAYWLIAPEVRYSGSGFLIKRGIADVRRELAAADRRSARLN